MQTLPLRPKQLKASNPEHHSGDLLAAVGGELQGGLWLLMAEQSELVYSRSAWPALQKYLAGWLALQHVGRDVGDVSLMLVLG